MTGRANTSYNNYNDIRVSVISYDSSPPTVLEEDRLKFTFSEPFVEKWTHSFDLGVGNTTCATEAEVLNTTSGVCEGRCLLYCSEVEGCR